MNFKAPVSKNLNLPRSENCTSGIYGPWAFCRCLIRASLDVRGHKKRVFPAACVIEKDVKVNIMLQCFELYVLLNLKAPVAENRIWASLKIVFLESMIHWLSVNALLLHY